jgi:hypothetical protein
MIMKIALQSPLPWIGWQVHELTNVEVVLQIQDVPVVLVRILDSEDVRPYTAQSVRGAGLI